jgi:hypothetical protein
MANILRVRDAITGQWIDIPAIIGKKGVSIVAVTKVGSVGLVDTYRIDYSDNTSSTFELTNGAQGEQGETGPKGDVDFVAATTLNQGEDATVTKSVDAEGKVTLTFGIPKGSASATFIDWGDEV